MTEAVVFELAVADGLSPVGGAAPWSVLARQVPRLLVAALNGDGDRGVRFLPFLGNDAGRRCFLLVRELLPVEMLTQMHRQGEVRCLVDGRLHEGGLRLRILDGATGHPRFEQDLPFDPRAPLQVLQRAEFEVMGVLGWQGRPTPPLLLEGEALAWYLVAKDALLALEAGLAPDGSFDALRAAQRCLALRPDVADVRTVTLELSAHLLRQGIDRAGVVTLLTTATTGDDVEASFAERAADLLLAAEAEEAATALLVRLARRHPARASAVHQAAAVLFRQGRLDEACAVLRGAVQAGATAVSVLAQLAGIEDLLGHRAERDALCEQILRAGDPPATVARLLAAFLLEQGRAGEALPLIERALLRQPEDAALLVERGRCLLLLGEETAATAVLRGVLERSEGGPRAEAERLLRVAEVPGMLARIQAAEAHLRHGRLREALGVALRLSRSAPRCAEAWLLLGVVRQKLEQPRRAEKVLRRALLLQPDLADAHNRLGILLVARGRAAEGHAHLERAQALAPADASIRVHLAQACALLDRVAEGERHLAEAERLGASPGTVAAVRRGFFTAGG